MLISTLNCEMRPNFSYRGVRSVQLLLLLLLLMVFSSENFGFSPPYAVIAGIGPEAPSFRTVLALNVEILLLFEHSNEPHKRVQNLLLSLLLWYENLLLIKPQCP